MKLYEVVDGRRHTDIYGAVYGRQHTTTDETVIYRGTDFEAAKEAKERVTYHNNNYLSAREIVHSYVAARIYEISDEVDLSDTNAVIDAICECCDCDMF